MSDAQNTIEESFVIVNYHLDVLTGCRACVARMTFWGRPEGKETIANYAEVEFLPDASAIPAPVFTRDLKPGVHRIGMWFPISQFDRIAAILRQSSGVRCHFLKQPNRDAVAGIKDWNTIGPSSLETAVEPTLHEVAARCSPSVANDEPRGP